MFAAWMNWLLRIAFHLLYNQLSWAYGAVAWLVSRGQWWTWGRTMLPHVQGPRVLELGHGPGHLLGTMLGAGMEVIGLDQSATMSRQAQKRLASCELSAPLVRGLAQKQPFASGVFQSVAATFPSETILGTSTLNEISRVLEPGGVLVIIPKAHLTRRNLVDRAIELAYRITGQRGAGDEQIENWLSAAGFRTTIHWSELPDSRVMIVVATPNAFRTEHP
jgi:ubiquinone/menaquinone biosynthesis C-methylase UbiE